MADAFGEATWQGKLHAIIRVFGGGVLALSVERESRRVSEENRLHKFRVGSSPKPERITPRPKEVIAAAQGGRRKEGSLRLIAFGFLNREVGLHLPTVRMVVGERRMRPRQVGTAISDLLRRQTELVPTDHALHRHTGASNARPVVSNVRRCEAP